MSESTTGGFLLACVWKREEKKREIETNVGLSRGSQPGTSDGRDFGAKSCTSRPRSGRRVAVGVPWEVKFARRETA